MPRRSSVDCLAVTRPGLEHVLAAELAALGLGHGEPSAGAVPFRTPERGLHLAVRWLRTATRVLVVAGSFRARTFGSLERGLAELPWGTWVADGAAVEVRARARRSRLHHTGAIAERVAAAIAEAVPGAHAAEAAGAATRVDVRLEEDRATVRVDAVGEPLDRRGWRLATAKAPLPPTVAAAALRRIGWDGAVPLLDPMCGSGTIAVEAALLAAGREPSVDRAFALQAWPSFAPGTWASAAVAPAAGSRTGAGEGAAAGGGAGARGGALVLAGDRDAGAVEAARGNAARAEVADLVEISQRPLSAAAAAVPEGAAAGWILTNPPWGHRVAGGGDLRDLHAALGQLRRRLEGWRLAVITGDPVLAGHTGVALAPAWRTTVGGRAVVLLVEDGG